MECPNCGRLFTADRSRGQRWCSDRCRRQGTIDSARQRRQHHAERARLLDISETSVVACCLDCPQRFAAAHPERALAELEAHTLTAHGGSRSRTGRALRKRAQRNRHA